MTGLQLLWPEIVLAAFALGLLLCDLFVAPRHGRILYHLAWIAAAITLCLAGFTLSEPMSAQGLGSLWAVDPLSQFFKIMVLIATILAVLLSLGYRGMPAAHAGTFSCLLLLSAVGMMFLVSAVDLLAIFIALELISLASFVLAGFERSLPKSNEGAMKYFIFGAFSSAVMVYGISLVYGATGTTSLIGVKPEGPVFLLGILFVLLGFGFKASIAPMHFWVPDAYEGAPTPVTAFLSVAPKIAAMGAVARVFAILAPAGALELTTLLSLLAGLTMTIGNFTALFQNNVKRLLAYSSIAQAGYILIGVVAGTPLGLEGILLYSFVYIAMNVGAFAVAIAVGNEGSYELEAFDGLSQRSFGLALALTLCLLSLSGIPPLAGFVGKFYLFSAAVDSGHIPLAVVGLVNSVVSVYYYMRIVYRMFFVAPKTASPVWAQPALYGGLALALAGVLFFGIYPEPLIASVQINSQYLP